MTSMLHVVAGGQYGSEGKGAVAGALAAKYPGSVNIRVGGPNAGHTVYDAEQNRWPLRTIPVGAAVDPECLLVIGAGSEIDLEVIWQEVTDLEAKGHEVQSRLMIDSQATILEPHHRDMESDGGLVGKIGSTGKGIGAARAERMMRKAAVAATTRDHDWGRELPGTILDDTHHHVREHARKGRDVIIEGTQGYGLGLHAGHYPKSTTNDCRAIDFLSQAGLSPWDPVWWGFVPWVVFRAFPIRVAGPSGPLLGETSWEELGLPEERTTVTQKVRRVGRWDGSLAAKAVEANGGSAVQAAFTMLDHVFPEIQHHDDREYLSDEAQAFIREREQELGVPIGYIGTGPATYIWGL